MTNRDNFWLCVIKGCHPTSCTTRTDPWSIDDIKLCTATMDLGSVRKIRRISGMPIAYSLVLRKEFMSRRGAESIKVLINHWRWLEANGYKQQAASCKQQAASLTRKHYNDIGLSYHPFAGVRCKTQTSKTKKEKL